MDIQTFLGWVKSFMDSFGLTPILYGIVILGLAIYAINRIMGRD